MNSATPRVVVIGAGIGGLTTAAVLAREGMDVTVLEAQVYPGGCAATYYHQGYRFDAGATLAGGFYPGGPMDLVARATGIKEWQAHLAQAAMMVHLPDDQKITLWNDERRWSERERLFGDQGIRFWRWQERTADAMWDLAMRLPPWPPQSYRELAGLTQLASSWLINLPNKTITSQLLSDAVRPVAAHLKNTPDVLRLFTDAQLLISAQATSDRVNALYGASALDLSRRGVVHLEGGMGSIAQSLVRIIQQHGGQVMFRQEATRIALQKGAPKHVETKRGSIFPADIVIANLPPANLRNLLGDNAPSRIKNASTVPQDGWGAFIMYVGIESSVIPEEYPLHHQVVTNAKHAEGNSIFISINPSWDHQRAPSGYRAVTISTHTNLTPWWQIYHEDKAQYESRKNEYADKVMSNAERALPGFRRAAKLILPGTPITFQRFTRRIDGWVGGFPQTHLLRTLSPKIGKYMWMVGDSIFPGQSTAATALGGLRVARHILDQLEYKVYLSSSQKSLALARTSHSD